MFYRKNRSNGNRENFIHYARLSNRIQVKNSCFLTPRLVHFSLSSCLATLKMIRTTVFLKFYKQNREEPEVREELLKWYLSFDN